MRFTYIHKLRIYKDFTTIFVLQTIIIPLHIINTIS